MANIKNKIGQMAVFVIIGLVMAAAIGLYFVFQKKPVITGAEEYDVQQFIEKCVQKHASEAEKIMLPQGGFISPVNYKRYNSTEVSYLCKNIGYFKPCINQHPMLINEMSSELHGYLEPRIEECFTILGQDLEKKNYAIQQGILNLSISLAPERIYVDITKPITLSKQDAVKTFEHFPITIISPMYDLGEVAQKIASQEAVYCYFEYVGYMLLYPKWDIRKFTMSDATKIYTITDKEKEAVMNIAIRGCAIPAGI